MKEKLAVIGGLILIIVACWGAFTYLEKFARCEEVQKIDQKVDKSLREMDYRFMAIQFETKEERIYKIEERVGKTPKDPIVKEILDKLKKERDQILRKMKIMEKNK